MGLYVVLYRDVACLESPGTAAWFKQEIGVCCCTEDFPDQLSGLSSLLYKGVKQSGCGIDHPPHLVMRLKKE